MCKRLHSVDSIEEFHWPSFLADSNTITDPGYSVAEIHGLIHLKTFCYPNHSKLQFSRSFEANVGRPPSLDEIIVYEKAKKNSKRVNFELWKRGRFERHYLDIESLISINKDKILNCEIGDFIEILRKFQQNLPPILVDISFEVMNGFSGMLRDTILRLCHVIAERRWMNRKTKDQSIRMVMGMNRGHLLWKTHSHFIKSRIQVKNSDEELVRIQPLVNVYSMKYLNDEFCALVSESNPSVVDDVLYIVEMLSMCRGATQGTELFTVLLECLLKMKLPRASATLQNQTVSYIVSVMRMFASSSSLFSLPNRRRAYIFLTKLHNLSWWTPLDDTKTRAAYVIVNIKGLTEIIASYECDALECEKESVSMNMLVEATTLVRWMYGKADDEQKRQCDDELIAATVKLLVAANTKASTLALGLTQDLLSQEKKEDSTSYIRHKLISAGFLAGMEQRLRIPQTRGRDREEYCCLIKLCGDGRDHITHEAIASSGIIPLVIQSLQRYVNMEICGVQQTLTDALSFLVIMTGEVTKEVNDEDDGDENGEGECEGRKKMGSAAICVRIIRKNDGAKILQNLLKCVRGWKEGKDGKGSVENSIKLIMTRMISKSRNSNCYIKPGCVMM